MTEHARLESITVGEIEGRFCVPSYQRGYRWRAQQVRLLLDDVWASAGEKYSLQPIVVKQEGDAWEVVDGQQRLTTLYLLFRYLERAGHGSVRYTLTYATRPQSESYLLELDEARAKTNIDFFHLYEAWRAIEQWFAARPKRDEDARTLATYLRSSVQVIRYEVPAHEDAITLFRRLNVGRIPLTDAELVKALLLTRTIDELGADRAQEIAAQWDAIERHLWTPDVWGFIKSPETPAYATRIGLLLDSIAEEPKRGPRKLFDTFDRFRTMIEEARSAVVVWERVEDLHAQIVGWYEDRSTYHKIGFLVAQGDRIANLVPLAAESTKRTFDAKLDERIRDKIGSTPSALADLTYNGDDKKCSMVLFLMNVETTRGLDTTSERYPFHLHAAQTWSLEHIHAQHAQALVKEADWNNWIDLHLRALSVLPESERGPLSASIETTRARLNRQTFGHLVREVTAAFDRATHGAYSAPHSISNLALLSRDDNSALNNAVFEVKRRRIIELDRNGAFIPICTRRVFLEYYARQDDPPIHFWSQTNREAYLAEMLDVLAPYLSPEATR